MAKVVAVLQRLARAILLPYGYGAVAGTLALLLVIAGFATPENNLPGAVAFSTDKNGGWSVTSEVLVARVFTVGCVVACQVLTTSMFTSGKAAKSEKRKRAFFETAMFCFTCAVVIGLQSSGHLFETWSSNLPFWANGGDARLQDTPLSLGYFILLSYEAVATFSAYKNACVLVKGEQQSNDFFAPVFNFMSFLSVISFCGRVALRVRPTTATVAVVAFIFVLLLIGFLRVQLPLSRFAMPVMSLAGLRPHASLIAILRFSLYFMELGYVSGKISYSTMIVAYNFMLLGSASVQTCMTTLASASNDETAVAQAQAEALNAQLKLKTDQLLSKESADASRQRFMRYIFHEIRVPFNSLVIGLSLLEDDEQSNLSLEGQATLDMLSKSAAAAKTLLNDVLDFSKIESGAFQVSMVPTKLRELANSTVLSMTPMACDPDVRVALSSTIDSSLPTCVLADKVRLQQVVANLLSNAIKFAPHDGTGKVTVDISVLPEGRLHVENGTGCLLLQRSGDVDPVGLLSNIHWRAAEPPTSTSDVSTAAAGTALARTSTLASPRAEPPVLRSRFGAATLAIPSRQPNQTSQSPNLQTIVTVGSPVTSAGTAEDRFGQKNNGLLTSWATKLRANMRNGAEWLTSARSARIVVSSRDIQPPPQLRAIAAAGRFNRRHDSLRNVELGGAVDMTIPHVLGTGKAQAGHVGCCSEQCFLGSYRLPQMYPPIVEGKWAATIAAEGFAAAASNSSSASNCLCISDLSKNRYCTLMISVKDNGDGIAADEAKLLFRAFRQLDAGLQYKGKGTGLGLAICHEIISLHGGRVGVRSAGVAGQGAEFIVLLRLPVLRASGFEANTDTGESPSAPSPFTATAALEPSWGLQRGASEPASAQEVVECSFEAVSGNCDDGTHGTYGTWTDAQTASGTGLYSGSQEAVHSSQIALDATQGLLSAAKIASRRYSGTSGPSAGARPDDVTHEQVHFSTDPRHGPSDTGGTNATIAASQHPLLVTAGLRRATSKPLLNEADVGSWGVSSALPNSTTSSSPAISPPGQVDTGSTSMPATPLLRSNIGISTGLSVLPVSSADPPPSPHSLGPAVTASSCLPTAQGSGQEHAEETGVLSPERQQRLHDSLMQRATAARSSLRSDGESIPVAHGYHGLRSVMHLTASGTHGQLPSLALLPGPGMLPPPIRMGTGMGTGALSHTSGHVGMANHALGASVATLDVGEPSGPVMIRPLRLLVVDDVSENRRLLARVLSARILALNKGRAPIPHPTIPGLMLDVQAVEVHEAADGHFALSMALGLPLRVVEDAMAAAGKGEAVVLRPGTEVHVQYDIITMDAEMPVLSGFLTTKALRAAGCTVPIYGCTGNSLPEDQAYFRSCGVDEVFVKPVAVATLVQTVLKALGIEAQAK